MATTNEPLVPVPEAILADIATVLQELRSTDRSDPAAPWTCRRYALLLAMFPVATFLDQAGATLHAGDFYDVNRLDLLLDRALLAYGFGFEAASHELRRLLLLVPGYRAASVGNQRPETEEHFVYYIMGAAQLRSLARTEAASAAPQRG